MADDDLLVLRGRVSKADSLRDPYLYLPFEVPAGTTRLDVRLEHDDGNVIDLGILDPLANGFPATRGFRGWSGGARDRFFIATDEATPGYLPGPISPGSWRVILGLYRVKPEGCEYRVEIGTSAEPRDTIGPAREHPAFTVPAGWYPGDLQSHTHHSDARGSIDDLIEAARHNGLRFLAVTDHNTTSHHRHLAEASSEDLFLLPGEEVTTDQGHANVWGAGDWVDFRITEPGHLRAVVRRAHQLGGLISINHPKPGGPDWRYPVPEEVDCVEAWQSRWSAGNDRSLRFYDRLLHEGRRPVLVGGSDRHQPGWPDPDPPQVQIGSPTTWLWLDEFSIRACLAAVASGRVFVSESPSGPMIELTVDGVPMGGTLPPAGRATASIDIDTQAAAILQLVDGSGRFWRRGVSAGARHFDIGIDLARAAPFVRAELWDETGERVIALSNPIFLANE